MSNSLVSEIKKQLEQYPDCDWEEATVHAEFHGVSVRFIPVVAAGTGDIVPGSVEVFIEPAGALASVLLNQAEAITELKSLITSILGAYVSTQWGIEAEARWDSVVFQAVAQS